MKLVHNKKNNLSLLFEFLLQETIEATIEKKFNKKQDLLKIIKKYYFQNKYLREEFNIASSLLNSEFNDKTDAVRFILEHLKAIEGLNKTLTERKKYKQQLLEDIYKVCNKETFFNKNVPYYNVYATTNLLIDYYSKNKQINEVKYLIELEKNIVNHLLNNKIIKENKEIINNILTENLNNTDDVSNLIAINKYKELYFNKLTTEQQEIIEFYISAPHKELIENKLDKHYRTNYNKIRDMWQNEKVDFTKEKLNESLVLLTKNYKEANSIEDKLTVVLDSFNLLS